MHQGGTMNQHLLANDIQQAIAQVHSDEPSTTNWSLVEQLVAEALGVDENTVYGSTISKTGNLTVRMDQSPKARNASIFLAMYTGASDAIAKCVDSAVRQARAQGRQLVLVFADHGAGMTLEAGIKPANSPVPSPLAQAYPNAAWIDY